MTTFGYGSANAADGSVFSWVFPIGTSYWSQAAAMVQYLGQKEGGLDKLKGKKIVHLYHDSAFGKEPIPVFEALAAKHGFELMKHRRSRIRATRRNRSGCRSARRSPTT